jgi:hypothetical protein
MAEWRPDSTLRVAWPTGTTSAVHLWFLPADVAGTWEVATPGRRYRVRLEQEFQRLSGTASHAGRTVELTGAQVSGDSVAFTLADTLGGERAILNFRGRVAGGAMNGTVAGGGGSAVGRWRAVRPY